MTLQWSLVFISFSNTWVYTLISARPDFFLKQWFFTILWKKSTFSSSPLQPQSWCSSRDFSLTDIQTVQSQKLQQITSGHEQNCRHQVTSDKSSAGQKWTIAQNNVNHNNIYNDLIVSTSNVSPCVPSRGYVDFSTQLCVRCLDERADNSRTPVWQMVRLTLCGSVSNKPCCHC